MVIAREHLFAFWAAEHAPLGCSTRTRISRDGMSSLTSVTVHGELRPSICWYSSLVLHFSGGLSLKSYHYPLEKPDGP